MARISRAKAYAIAIPLVTVFVVCCFTIPEFKVGVDTFIAGRRAWRDWWSTWSWIILVGALVFIGLMTLLVFLGQAWMRRTLRDAELRTGSPPPQYPPATRERDALDE